MSRHETVVLGGLPRKAHVQCTGGDAERYTHEYRALARQDLLAVV